MVKRDLEIGAEVLRAVEESEPFALRALEWLLSRQETDEIAAGTSTHKNGRGLNKRDAEFLQSHPPRSLTTEEVRLIVCRYTHTQLVDGVTDGELDLPEKKNVTPYRREEHNVCPRFISESVLDGFLSLGYGKRGKKLFSHGIDCAVRCASVSGDRRADVHVGLHPLVPEETISTHCARVVCT